MYQNQDEYCEDEDAGEDDEEDDDMVPHIKSIVMMI